MSDHKPSEEPAFISQTAESMTIPEQYAWLDRQIGMAKAEGVKFVRVSKSIDGTNMVLIEGWIKQPDDQGDPRFQVTAKQ